uniref:C2 domain-containing protein n=1 Tax=Fagus sylvatica TaxID=28930 RepID=A0A2N9EKF3_FAGSY
MTGGIIVIKPIFFFSFPDTLNNHSLFLSHHSSSSSSSHSSLSLLLAWLILSVYALVSLVSHDPNKKLEQNQQQRTPTDKDGDPEWNHEMRFDLNEVSLEDCDHVFIHFDLRHEGVMFGDKNIGEVHVAFKDLMEESNGVVRFASYLLQWRRGITDPSTRCLLFSNGFCSHPRCSRWAGLVDFVLGCGFCAVGHGGFLWGFGSQWVGVVVMALTGSMV